MGPSAAFETVIGLEIHVQLKTRTKLFCGCSPRFGDAANVHTCPVCLGLPGVLPVVNARALEQALRTALALGCRIVRRHRFARKNYFYPDLPKGYQISQFDRPIGRDGSFSYELDGERRTASIQRLHLEEDAGKSIHRDTAGGGRTLVDLNRCGVPLIEIVTGPDLAGAEEADAFLTTLRRTLLYLGVTDASMEEGSLRCDANVSVRPQGQAELNPKTELKNLNSFRFLRRALRYEEGRQAELLQGGGEPSHSTRTWDEAEDRTVSMRAKEEAHDYRYFPEPDLPPLLLAEETIAETRESLPELPVERVDRFVSGYDLPIEDATVLCEERARADFFEATVEAGADPAAAGNWIRGEVLRVLNDRGIAIGELPVGPESLAGLLEEVESGRISGKIAKRVFDRMLDEERSAREIIVEEGLEQIDDAAALEPVVQGVLDDHPEEVEAYRGGRHQVLGYLMGQVMRATDGRANPRLARRLLQRELDDGDE